MMIFALCLLAAGAVLSLLTRVHGLMAVALGVGAASAVVAALHGFGAGPAYPLGVTLVVAIVVLQVGYGLGVVARAVLGPRLRRPTGAAPGLTPPDAAPARKAEQTFGRES